jgi:hypothetical protein
MIEKRLLSDSDENLLCDNAAVLTNLKQHLPLSTEMGPQLFATRVMDKLDFLKACHFVHKFEPELSDISLRKQIHLFLTRLHHLLPYFDNRAILQQFLSKEDLYEAIPDLLHCISKCFLLGHVESYVESIGSKLKHHNRPNRNLTNEHLEEELIISWNGPEIQHADDVIKKTIDRMYPGKWHFTRTSRASKLKFSRVSQAVDKLQNTPSSFYL